MSEVLEFLNTNSSVVTAVAALVSAAATAFVAVFSYGTWKLYRLERRQASTRKVQLGHQVGRSALEFETAVLFFDFLRKQEGSDSGRVMYDLWLHSPERELASLEEELPELIEVAKNGHPEAMSALLAAQEQVEALQRSIPELRRKLYMRTEDEPEKVLNLEQLEKFRDSLASLAGTLRQVPEAQTRTEAIEELKRRAERSDELEKSDFASDFEELVP